MEILRSYTFQLISIGTLFLAVASAIVGSLNLYKGQSLIGDAIGHSSFPGIVLIFMVFQTRNPNMLFVGAVLAGGLSYFLIQVAKRNSKVSLDACLAIFLSGFFGLGMVLKSIIQGNPKYQAASQSGLGNYIFGQAAYMMEKDIKLIVVVSIIVVATFILFYKQLVVFTFDTEFSKTIGLNTRLIEGVLLFMTIGLVGIGLKAVGSILISSFLILPCVAANQWSKKFSRVLVVASLVGGLSAILGTYFSSIYSGLSTGPTIILSMGSITIFSMLFGPYGTISKSIKLRRTR